MKRLLLMLGLGLMNAIGSAQTNLPVAPASNQVVIAILCGKEITSIDQATLKELIFKTLLEKFAKENNIAPTEAELDTFIIKSEEKEKQTQLDMEQDAPRLRKELKSTSLSDRERKNKETQLMSTEQRLRMIRDIQKLSKGKEEQISPMRRQWAEHVVKSWKIKQALYQKYGGRVCSGSYDAEPWDAYRDFLKEQEKAGVFQIFDEQYKGSFWRTFGNDAMHKFYSKEDGDAAFFTPWWLMEKKLEPPATGGACKMISLGNEMTLLDNETIPLGNQMISLGNETISLGNQTTSLDNGMISLGNKIILKGCKMTLTPCKTISQG